ncbi:GNAT family acetyltransferase [Listeria booriae]|uniref:GNAT family acetyltransferase n=1 Tax=Listeria booriae TaxID=1552123 RepID=UPI0021ADFF04|nr:GNAT family acetyltransferase [Listeria booriae]
MNVISLADLLSSSSEEEVTSLLSTFECGRLSAGANDVEFFLRNKAIQFEKIGMAKTYLVMSTYKKKHFIAGYFAIIIRPLVVPKRSFKLLSKNFQKRLMGFGHKTDVANYEMQGYLLGQLGKNYSEISRTANAASGSDLIGLAYSKVLEAKAIAGGRVLHLECEDNLKIISFYESCGFTVLEDYISVNKLRIMVKRLE